MVSTLMRSCSVAAYSWVFVPGEGHGGHVGVAKDALSHAGDPEPARAMGIRAGDLRIRRHPVVGMRGALLRGQERQQGGQRIDREALARRQMEHLPFELEEVAGRR